MVFRKMCKAKCQNHGTYTPTRLIKKNTLNYSTGRQLISKRSFQLIQCSRRHLIHFFTNQLDNYCWPSTAILCFIFYVLLRSTK